MYSDNQSSNYINGNLIKGHGKYISINKLKDLIELAENSICKIKYIDKSGTGFFFQQNISNIKFYKKYFLMTNNHVLNGDFFENSFQLLIEFKNKERKIPLNNRIKYTNNKLDFTIIEILSQDTFFNEITFLNIDDYIMDNKSESKYSIKDICIFQFPEGELSFDKGEIESFEEYKIKYFVSTESGSSGSPILLLNNNFKIIGIHKGSINRKNNLGIFMKYSLNDLNSQGIIIIIKTEDLKVKL